MTMTNIRKYEINCVNLKPNFIFNMNDKRNLDFAHELHSHEEILRFLRWKYDMATANALYGSLYEPYMLRAYSIPYFKFCIAKALKVATFLCLFEEPETEITPLFNHVRDWCVAETQSDNRYYFDNWLDFVTLENPDNNDVDRYYPTAFLLDGIFSAVHYIFCNLKEKSHNLEIADKMITQLLYPYIEALPEHHKAVNAQWNFVRYTKSSNNKTLLECLPEKTDLHIELKSEPQEMKYNYYPQDIGFVNYVTGTHASDCCKEDIRIITSMYATKKDQERYLSTIIANIKGQLRRAFKDLAISGLPILVTQRLYAFEDYISVDILERIESMDADALLSSEEEIIASVQVPQEWGTMVKDKEGHDIVVMHEKLEPIYYGTRRHNELNMQSKLTEADFKETVNIKPLSIFSNTFKWKQSTYQVDGYKFNQFIKNNIYDTKPQECEWVALYYFFVKDIECLERSAYKSFVNGIKLWFPDAKFSTSLLSKYYSQLSRVGSQPNIWETKFKDDNNIQLIRVKRDQLIAAIEELK